MPSASSRTSILFIGALVFAGLAGFIGYISGSSTKVPNVRSYAEVRSYIVGHQSANLTGAYILIAGDSHAELALPAPPSCDRTYLNAGVTGAKADDYIAFLDTLALRKRASVAVVTLGTNHLLRKRNPAGPAAGDRYEADLAEVVRRLSRHADRVVVAAVPPVAASLDKFVDHAGVRELTARQKRVCDRLGCETADPYAAYRSREFGVTRPDATRDGLHLDEYATAYKAIDRVLCQ